jgi:hypothetical protein
MGDEERRMSEGGAGASPSILLVDDGELDDVARRLERLGCDFERLQGSAIPREIAPPRDLLITTPRRLERVRRGSPAEAASDRPLRIVAVDEDSAALRRRLRSAGLHLIVPLPAHAEIWRLLVSRALYRGEERRRDLRVAVGSPVEIVSSAGVPASGPSSDPSEMAPETTLLMDLSNRGCRLRTARAISIGDALSFTIAPEAELGLAAAEPLELRGRVRRMTRVTGSAERSLALVFDPDLPEATRVRLTALINRWASGPSSTGGAGATNEPPLPPCRLPSLPDLMLDDETDPPVRARAEVRVELGPASPVAGGPDRSGLGNATDAGSGTGTGTDAASSGSDRRRRPRGRFETSFLAETPRGPLVLLGRELSARGMRVERLEELRVGDRFRLALHGPGPTEPLVVEAEVARDDGSQGYALLFRDLGPQTETALEKLVACLPSGDGEASEPGEPGRLGDLLSEILSA